MVDQKHYTVEDVNPRSATAKGLEMTTLRALQIIEAFEALDVGQDWRDVPASAYRQIIGEGYKWGRMLEECWNRYEDGTLYRQVLDLFENLPPTAQQRKEIADGITRINSRSDSRGKKRSAKPAARRRSRQ
jgi:hypothetical protein